MTYTIDELLMRSHGEWLAAESKLTFETRPFIDGTFTDATSGDSFTSVSPRDGAVLTEVQAAWQ
ncbi:hypothetical protein WKI71_01475 [Streptomyces sp. MS1.AVA.1]|uniref:Uncharacterized protein n=1 Tax=Streptomyces machairae TaxID=3134109 RepID=A0ABU8UFN1_9ACTN